MNPNWMRDYLVLPLIVGVVGVIGTFVLPRFFQDNLELSYETEGPDGLIDSRVDGTNIRFKVNEKEAQSVFLNRVRLWNSGIKPVEKIPVTFEFDIKNDGGFEILSVTHKTKPEREFGAITELGGNNNSRRIQYEFLNSGNEDVVSFLSTRETQIKVYANAKGMSLINRTKEKTQWFLPDPWGQILFALWGVMFGLALQRAFSHLQGRNR